MGNDKYDAFPQAIIILLLDLFLVCRWRGHENGWRGEPRAAGYQLERYKRVRRTESSSTLLSAFSFDCPPLSLSFFLHRSPVKHPVDEGAQMPPQRY